MVVDSYFDDTATTHRPWPISINRGRRADDLGHKLPGFSLASRVEKAALAQAVQLHDELLGVERVGLEGETGRAIGDEVVDISDDVPDLEAEAGNSQRESC